MIKNEKLLKLKWLLRMLGFKALAWAWLNKLCLFRWPLVQTNECYGRFLNTSPWRIRSLRRGWRETDDGVLQKCSSFALGSQHGREGEGGTEGGVWKSGKNKMELIWTCFYSEDNETCPLTTGIDQRKQSSIKERGARGGETHRLIWGCLKKDPGVHRELLRARDANSSGKLMLIGV